MTEVVYAPDGSIIETINTPPQPSKVKGLTYDEFRKLFSVAELTLLDSFDVDAFVQSVGLTPLTVAQKANVRFLISEAKATGSGPIGINLASGKMASALAALQAYGAISNERRLEILAGTQKS